jgi:hypothetical protein
MDELEFALEQPQRWAERRRLELGQTTDAEATRYKLRQAITVNVMRVPRGQPAKITLSRRLPFPKYYLYAGAAIALVSPLVIWLSLRKPAKPPPALPPVAAVAVPELVRTRVASIPSGATVLDGDRLLGTTPFDIERPTGAKLELQVKLDKYEPAKRVYVVNAPREIEFTLQKSVVAGRKRQAKAKSIEKPLDPDVGLLPAKF